MILNKEKSICLTIKVWIFRVWLDFDRLSSLRSFDWYNVNIRRVKLISILILKRPRGGLWASTESKVIGIERPNVLVLTSSADLARATGNQYKLPFVTLTPNYKWFCSNPTQQKVSYSL